MTIYLYVKQCPHCGLKYFGKTVSKDPYKYKGSGTIWMRHIKKHNVVPYTIEMYTFQDKNEAINFALSFSKEHNIVESNEWANLVTERIDGGFEPGKPHTLEHRLKISKGLSGRVPTKQHTDNIWITRKSRYKNGVTDETRQLRKSLFSGSKNPMAQNWTLHYKDGHQVQIDCLKTWALNNGYKYNTLYMRWYNQDKAFRDGFNITKDQILQEEQSSSAESSTSISPAPSAVLK